MRTTFVKTLSAIADENPNVWLLCGDLGFSVLEEFASRHPDRYINVGVAEQNMAGIAAGLALSGKTVFIYSIGNFPTLRCLEQLRNDVCYHGADVKVVAVGAGFAYGSQGYTHHAIEDVAIMSALPGMEVFVPCDPLEVQAVTRLISNSGKPAYLRLSRAGEPVLHQAVPSNVRKMTSLRQGKDLALLASGPIVSICLEAANSLALDKIEVEVVSVPCLKPFDEATLIDVLSRKNPVLTVEEHILHGGLYARVAGFLAPLKEKVVAIGMGIPEPTGKISRGGDRDVLLADAGLSAASVAEQVRLILNS